MIRWTWITPSGDYYVGHYPGQDYVPCDPRPSDRHVWQGGVWVLGPAQARKLVPLDFLNLFTEAEQLAVVQAGLVNAAVKLWYDKALAATFITRDDPQVEGGLQALVDAGLLTDERKQAVLAAMLEAG